ncbi:MAG: NYN domain-containing protein [Alphaproteobacteria bacterium]
MGCVAIFVDAGYLFAQGSTALTSAKKPRADLKLNETAVIAELTAVAHSKSDSARLLRVYWYDGVVGYKGPTLQQDNLAHLDNVKLRLGFVNSHGQQKGVDSLIVTDLIELARNQAITDAVLLSGDEDVRIGVQIAQNFGVRVHLIGIHPSRGSQSKQLLQESDTTTEWDKTTVAKFLAIVSPVVTPVAAVIPTTLMTAASHEEVVESAMTEVATTLVTTLDTSTIVSLKEYWKTKNSIPSEYDGKLLGKCRDAIHRELSLSEKKFLRSKFKELVNQKV